MAGGSSAAAPQLQSRAGVQGLTGASHERLTSIAKLLIDRVLVLFLGSGAAAAAPGGAAAVGPGEERW